MAHLAGQMAYTHPTALHESLHEVGTLCRTPREGRGPLFSILRLVRSIRETAAAAVMVAASSMFPTILALALALVPDNRKALRARGASHSSGQLWYWLPLRSAG